MSYNHRIDTMNAIYEVYNVNHVKCEADDCCAECAVNFKIIKENIPYHLGLVDSNDWITFCMKNKNHIINNIMPIEYNSSITKNTWLYDNGIIQPSLNFIRFLFNKNHHDLIYYVKKFLEFQKTKFCEDIVRQIRTIDVLKLIIDNNIYTYDLFLTLDLNNYPTLSKLLIIYDTIIYDTNIILSTCCPVNQVIASSSITGDDIVIEDDAVTNDEEDDAVTNDEEDARLTKDIYNQKNSFSPDYLEFNCVII